MTKKWKNGLLTVCAVLLLCGCGQNQKTITEEQAVSAVKNYCYDSNPELKEIEDTGDYPIYWEVESSGEDEIVVLFRSYTGAQVRFYIDPESGDTHSTEFVPGVTEKEERAEELNIRDYLTQK